MAKLLPTNEIVARITGIGRRMFTSESTGSSDDSDFRQSPSSLTERASDMVNFNNVESESKPRRQETGERCSVMEAIQQMKSKARGDNAAFDYPKATDSQDEKIPSHKMADSDVDDEMYGSDDQDSEPQTIKKPTSESVNMKKFINEHIHGMDTFRFYAGLPLSEDKSGDVPTAGAHKVNKMKAGLSGLEGDSLQAIEPEDMEDDVGSDQYTVLDQAIAMLKKEGIDTDALWGEFLENRGLTIELFHQLVDEAMDSDDADEMDALIAVEDLFVQELPKLLPEGIFDRLRGVKKPDPAYDLTAVRQGGERLRQLGKGAVQAANNTGTDVKAPTNVPAGGPVKLVRPAGAGPEKFEPGQIRQRQNRPTLKMQAVKAESIEECACQDMAKKMKPAKGNKKIAKLTAKYAKKGK